MSIRVLVVDDQELVRAGLCGIVGSAPDLTVVGDAGDGATALVLAREHLPDVVLMDVRMPVMDGLEATRRISAATRARVLVLTTFDIDEYVYEALRAGASGFLVKDTPPTDLLTAIRIVAQGDSLLSPGVTRRLIARFLAPGEPTKARPTSPDPFEALTPREREVLGLIAGGLTNPEICRRLHISPGTTKSHVGSLLAKLRARDRVHLVILAYEGGLVAEAPPAAI